MFFTMYLIGILLGLWFKKFYIINVILSVITYDLLYFKLPLWLTFKWLDIVKILYLIFIFYFWFDFRQGRWVGEMEMVQGLTLSLICHHHQGWTTWHHRWSRRPGRWRCPRRTRACHLTIRRGANVVPTAPKR